MENKILKMEKENVLLKETVAAQERDLDKMKKTSLTESQATSLLEELVFDYFLCSKVTKCTFIDILLKGK